MRPRFLFGMSALVLFSCGSSPASTPVESTTYHFYCVNDFHGSVVEQHSSGHYESGIAKYFGTLKELKAKDPEHTVILSAGDMFQGSYESNANLGRLVIEGMNDVGFDAMTLGNHEFDYGPERLRTNIGLMDFPVLGGNVRKYENGMSTADPWMESIQSSTVIERGGHKIGVVGMIGYGQTTSITSSYVADADFVSPTFLAKQEASRLRKDVGCDIVVYAIHDEMSSCQSYAADKTFFDGVFTAHTHTRENKMVNGVPFVQSYCNGQALSHFDITLTGKEAKCTDHGLVWIPESADEDSTIADIRDSYIKTEDFVAKAASIAGTVRGTLASKEGVPNLSVQAMYAKYKPLHPEITLAMSNGLRAPLTGEIRYRDIVKAMPFTNRVVIAKVKGSEILNEYGYGNCVYSPERSVYDPDADYVIACIDYVLLHQNVNKQYNYFPSLNGAANRLIETHEEFPFDLTFDYVRNNLNGQIDADDFLSSAPGFAIG